jgi:cell division transport system permease protein
MPFLRLILFFIKEGFLGITRHKTLNFFALFIVSLSLFVLGFSRYITSNIYNVLSGWEESFELRIILKDSMTSEDINKIISFLKEKPIVDSFKVITPKEALSTIEKISPALKSLSFKESENPLPYSISVKLKKPIDEKNVSSFLNDLKNLKEVDETIFDWQWLNKLKGYLKFLTFLSWLLFVALGVASLFTVTSIIRIIGLSRKDEISILYSLGATPIAIRGPFITLGIIIGLLSSIIAILILLFVHIIVRQTIEDPIILELLSGKFLTLFDQFALVIVGVILGGSGGFLSIGSIHEWKYSHYI